MSEIFHNFQISVLPKKETQEEIIEADEMEMVADSRATNWIVKSKYLLN